MNYRGSAKCASCGRMAKGMLEMKAKPLGVSEERMVAALYVCKTGPYIDMPGVDCWTEDRDARTYEGPWPVVAHPPCAPWGNYRTARLSLYAPGRICAGRDPHKYADCGPRAVDQVRQFGGVLEHPARSHLWEAMGLPLPEYLPDRWGGFTVEIWQGAWGHAAPKHTWLYIVGGEWRHPHTGPVDPGGRVERQWSNVRHLTPPRLAAALVNLARSIRTGVHRGQS